MDKRTAVKAYRIQLEVALEKIARATRLAASGLTGDKKWKEFDKTCYEADFLVVSALCCVPSGFLSEGDEKKLISSLKELHAIRIEVWINWQMVWREQQAIANPKGKYGVMKARREALTATLQDGADDDGGNGHHSPKP